MQKSLKIGILGPESTGKSTIGRRLADELHLTYISEYARTYVSRTPHYTYQDVCHIAEQNRREWLEASGPTIFDTELLLTRVWMDEVYGRHEAWIDQSLHQGECLMDHYLLLYPDIAWQADPTRENGSPERREELFHTYLSAIQATGRPYTIIRGQGEARYEAARLSLLQLFA